MVKKWKKVSDIDCVDYKIFNIKRLTRESVINDKKGDFVLIDSPNWVTIIPVIHNEHGEECFLMVRQYRHGSDTITLEFPAGMVDRGEKSIIAAERELLEETGYTGEIKEIGSVNPNPAFMTNITTTYFATHLKCISSQDLDQNEEIDLALVPTANFVQKVGQGEINSAIMVQSYFFYLKEIKGIK